MSTWICIQNLSFQYSFEEAKAIFDSILHPIDYKWPSKNPKTSLGHIFLCFQSYQDAQNAIEIASSTPVNGKKLSASIVTNDITHFLPQETKNETDAQKSKVFNDKPIYPIEVLAFPSPTMRLFT